MNKRINTMYFSGTDTTKKVVCGIAEKLSEDFKVKEKINNVIDLSEKIERTKDMPIKNTITTQLGNKLIGTKKARFDDKKVVSFGAFEDEYNK